jgi:hypothetical protein
MLPRNRLALIAVFMNKEAHEGNDNGGADEVLDGVVATSSTLLGCGYYPQYCSQ